MCNVLNYKIMDGAMGTMILAQGIPINSCLEGLNRTHPSLISKIHKKYLKAGAEMIVANTFGANRPRLTYWKKQNQINTLNQSGVRIAKKAAGERKVLASIGPLGPHAQRMSSLEMRKHFREQVRALEEEKPYGYLIETMTSLKEALSAIQAVRQVSDRPAFVLLAGSKKFWQTGKSLNKVALSLRKSGADVLGFNCGTKLSEVYDLMKALSQMDPGPWCVRPSAGLPGKIKTPKQFATWGLKFKSLGCQWIGGCCGTTPEHIQSLRKNFPYLPGNPRS